MKDPIATYYDNLQKNAKKAIDAETRASQWLADGNEARENGKNEKAEKCYAKAQYWLDRANSLQGRA